MYLFLRFREIRRGITGGEMGAKELSWTELKSWSDLTRIRLAPWEARAIKLLDFTYLVTLRS